MIGLIIILSVLGFLMIFAEVYLPGGIMGALGGIALLGAVAVTFREYGPGVGGIMLSVFLVAGVASLTAGFYLLPKTRAGKVMMHNVAIVGDGMRHDALAVGSKGSALTRLQPSGTALIDDKRYDVLAQSGVIPRGTEIQIVRIEGSKIIVRPA